MDTLNIGVLAHVDAGKTSLCEALLFAGKSIKSLGRVDHKNSLLDMYAMERERGITIFSKQARIMLENLCITLLTLPVIWIFQRKLRGYFQLLIMHLL